MASLVKFAPAGGGAGGFETRFGLSFSGCGFLGTYHFGSVSCFLKHGTGLLAKTTKYAGASAGSLVAALTVLCPEKLNDSLQTMYTLADEVASLKFGALTPGFYLIERLESLVDNVLPQNAGQLATDRLFVSTTRFSDKSNVLTSKFDSREKLIKYLMASCYIPVYAGGGKHSAPKIDGEEHADGGLTDNLPKFEDVETITVSPFSGEAAISPFDPAKVKIFDWTMTLGNQQMKVNLKNIVRGAQALFPPKRSTLEKYHDMGFRDTMKFLLEKKLFERPEGTPV